LSLAVISGVPKIISIYPSSIPVKQNTQLQAGNSRQIRMEIKTGKKKRRKKKL